MNQIQEKSITLAVSKFNALGWWQGNKNEYVSAGTALGNEFTTVIYTPSAENKIGQFNPETQTWSERINNVLTPFWDKHGLAFSVDAPDTDFPDWAIFDAPPEHDTQTSYVLHDGKAWHVHSFDIDDEPLPEEVPEAEEPVQEPTKLELAQQYLLSTDWYVTRKLETGTAIPKEVMSNRDKCRALLVTQLPSTDFLHMDT